MDITRSSLQLFLANIGTAALSFIGLTVFARALTPAQLGAFFLFEAIVSVASLVTDFGLASAVEKRISEGRYARDVLATGLVMKTVFVIVASGAILLLRGPISEYIGLNVALLLVIALAFGELGDLMEATLRGELRVGSTAAVTFSKQLLWVGAGTALIAVGIGEWALFYALVIGLAVRAVFGVLRRSTPIGRPSRAYVSNLFDFGKYDLVNTVGWNVFNWMDILIIGWLSTQAAVGAYEVAWRVSMLTLLFSRALKFTVMPQVSAWDIEEAPDRIEGLIRNLITPSLLFIIPSVFGVFLLGHRILDLVFGPEYAIAWLALVILTGGKLVDGVVGLVDRCLSGIDRPDLSARATAVTIGLNVGLNLVLIPSLGIVGAAVATTTAYGVGGVISVFYLSSFLTIQFPYWEVGWCVLAAVIMALAIAGVQRAVVITTIPRLIFVVLLGTAVYGIVILASGQLRGRILTNARNLLA